MSKLLKIALLIAGPLAILVPGPALIVAAWGWPVACSTRGCISHRAWEEQLAAASQFAQETQTPPPTPAQALTTLIRQHLTRHAFLQSPISLADATRYREEILNLKEADQFQGALQLTLAEYDQKIILPFLQQEALRAQHKVESTDELYSALARERKIFLFWRAFTWDVSKGQVIEK